jgi:arsenite methyltransferase
MELRTPRFEVERLRDAVQREYTEVATQPHCTFHFLAGAPLAERLGYAVSDLAGLEETALPSFAGVGNPLAAGPVHPGETVLDVGSGAGLDALIAARTVAPTGQVIGVDMTQAMVDRATRNAEAAGVTNARFVRGLAEALPLPDASVDLVISNGAINLCPDKPAVFSEIFRVLRPGGRFQIADTLVETAVPDYVTDLIHLWTDCVAGGLRADTYVSMLTSAGFADVRLTHLYDTFRGAAVELEAGRYGARGHNLRGYKP